MTFPAALAVTAVVLGVVLVVALVAGVIRDVALTKAGFDPNAKRRQRRGTAASVVTPSATEDRRN